MQDFGLKGGKHDYAKYETALEQFIQSNHLQKKELCLQAGEAVIWQANLLHGGSPIRNFDRTRYSQVTHYFFDQAAYYTPKGSDLARDKIERRQVIDIRTGTAVKQYQNGTEIKLKWHELILPFW